MAQVLDELRRVAASPASHLDDETYGGLAQQLIDQASAAGQFRPRAVDAPYRIWGENLESSAVEQLKNACKLPVAVSGALMPDAHVGYGLPIGGVLATHEAVIPYAVGVDIACRMKMTVLDLPVQTLAIDQPRLARALERETRFGVGATFKSRHQHDVMDADWRVTSLTATLKDRAWSQLGTSGSGNHFVEFGQLTVLDGAVGLAPGNVPRAAQPLGQPRDRRGDRAALQPARARSASGAAQGARAPGLARSRQRGGPGVLGGDGVDGPLCRRESPADSRAVSPAHWASRSGSTSRTITTTRGANGTACRTEPRRR